MDRDSILKREGNVSMAAACMNLARLTVDLVG